MNTLQIWAVIGVPSFLVLVGILLNQQGLACLEHRMDRFEERMDRLDAMILRVNETLHAEVKDLLNMIGDYGQRIVWLEERRKL